jgi:glycerol-3-phosphate acyltransferase PlsY
VKFSSLPSDYAAWVGLAAFCGHVFSVFLRFRGGKGVATALGVFLGLCPLAIGCALIVFLVLMKVWRYVSLASVSAAVVTPIAVWALGGGRVLNVVTMLIAIIVIVRHTENIKRLAEGTENRFKA